VFGLFIACIYVSVFKMINEDYEEKDLIPANSTFQFIGTCGALFGSLICGFMINFFGAQGFPITICFGCLFYLTFSSSLMTESLRLAPELGLSS
jgi:MFS family permease